MSGELEGGLPGLGDAAEFAASALLGALLWRPERARDVASWLAAEDFARPAHGVIYRAILVHEEHRLGQRDLASEDDAEPQPQVALTAIARDLMAIPQPDLHTNVRDGSDPLHAAALHTLLALTPAGPDGPSEHVRYAQLVLEASIRRQISSAGTRIAVYARHVPTRRSDDAAAVMAQVTGQTATLLAELHRHLRTAVAPPGAIATALDPTYRSRSGLTRAAQAAAGTDSALWPHGATAAPLDVPTRAEIDRAEVALLGACTVLESVRTAALESLEVGDFLRVDAATTWMSMCRLADRGEPIDVVLLAAETEVVGATPGHEPGLTAQVLLRHAQRYGDPANGHRMLDTVARASLGRHAAAAGAALRTTAIDRTRRGLEVVTSAHAYVVELAAAAHRLSGATTTPPSPAALAHAVSTPPGPAPALARAAPPAVSPALPPAPRRPVDRPGRPADGAHSVSPTGTRPR